MNEKHVPSTPQKSRGRDKILINFEETKSLCSIGCTGEEIAAVIGVSYDTLREELKSMDTLILRSTIKNIVQ